MKKELLLAGILLPILAVILPHTAFACPYNNGTGACYTPEHPYTSGPNYSSPTHQHHTAEYLNGYNLGKSDGRVGVPADPGSPNPNWDQTQLKHYDQGYYDGYKSTYVCTSSPCNTVP